MLLIEIEGGGVPRFRLEFHPRLTVVAGLDEVQRRELSQAIINVLRGSGSRMKLNVDIGGVPQLYTYDTVLYTGLDKMPFDNVVSPATWRAEQERAIGAGARVVVAQPPVFTRTPAALRDGQALVDPDTQSAPKVDGDEAVAKADQQLQSALARVQQLEAQMVALAAAPPASPAGPPVDVEELHAAEAAVEDARAVVEDLQARLDESDGAGDRQETDPAAELEELTALKAAIERRLASLRSALEDLPGDMAAIMSALDDARRSADILRERDEFKLRIGRAGGEWNRITMEIGRLSRLPGPPEWLILETKDQLDEATARVTALTYQLQEGIEVREPLARAHQKLLEARAAWDELERGGDGKVAAEEVERSKLYEQISLLLGREVPYEQVIEALTAQHEEIQTQPHPAQRLVDELESAGVHASVDDALTKAESLLSEREQLARVREDNQRQMATAMVDLREVSQGIEAARHRLENPPDPKQGAEELQVLHSQATAALSEARRRLAVLEAKEAEFAQYDPGRGPALQAQLDAAHAAAALAQQELEAVLPDVSASDAHDAGEFGDTEVAEARLPGRPWWDGGLAALTPEETVGAPAAELDVYLLSRVAALRMVLNGESIPLIVDGVLEGLPQQEAGRVLEALTKVSSIVQVIYLASNADAAEKWAKRQEIFTTAVVRLERA